MNQRVLDFLNDSLELPDYVLQPLAHIRSDWELTWDDDKSCYIGTEDSFGLELNALIAEIASTTAPENYHDFEDKVAFLQSKTWKFISKSGRIWVGAEYESILEQGSFRDYNQELLLQSAAGRINAALAYDQYFFDDMEEGHKVMLSSLLSIILYQRC